MFMPFDLLHQDGVDLRGSPLFERMRDSFRRRANASNGTSFCLLHRSVARQPLRAHLQFPASALTNRLLLRPKTVLRGCTMAQMKGNSQHVALGLGKALKSGTFLRVVSRHWTKETNGDGKWTP
jgi:hypothetical protein